MTEQTEIQFTAIQKIVIGLIITLLGAFAVGAFGVAWNTREMVIANSARLDHIEKTRFTNKDAMALVESLRVIVRTEVDRALHPIQEDIRELKTKVDK